MGAEGNMAGGGTGDLGMDQPTVTVSRGEALRPKGARVQPGSAEERKGYSQQLGRGLLQSIHHWD